MLRNLFLANPEGADQKSLGLLLLNALKQAITNPIVIAMMIGLLLSALAIPLPQWLSNSLKSLGAGTSTTALIAVGITLIPILRIVAFNLCGARPPGGLHINYLVHPFH